MDYSKNEVMALMKADVNDNFNVNVSAFYSEPDVTTLEYKTTSTSGTGYNGSGIFDTIGDNKLSAWDYYQNYYYPYVIKESYPVYIQERAQDKGKQAFEIIKILKDKGLVKIKKVEDFIEAMDELIKIL